jgi:hypothetical protein
MSDKHTAVSWVRALRRGSRTPSLCVLATISFVLMSVPVAGAVPSSVWPGMVVAASQGHRLHAQAHSREIGRYRARSAIVGGGQISIEQAPWQVEMEAEFEYNGEKLSILCGGSLVDPSHVLTAAHCVFDPFTGERLPATSFAVVAGTSGISKEAIEASATVQASLIAAVRVHPYFEYAEGPGTPDDVAVLTLTKPLVETSAVQPIGLVAAGSTPPEGTPVELAGFGQQNPVSEPNGELYSLGMTLGFSGGCGGEADAVFLCATASGGSACGGDSGSGLTSGSPATLVGVLSTIEVISGKDCRDGADNGFTNLAAPEIRDFVENENSPLQKAPRGGLNVSIGFVGADREAKCEPGSWNGTPTFTYTFLDSNSGQILQSGSSSTYRFVSSDMGRTIYCQVQAGNPGGVAIERTATLGPITTAPEAWVSLTAEEGVRRELAAAEEARKAREAANQPPAPLPTQKGEWCGEQAITCEDSELTLVGARIVVHSDGVALVKLECSGTESCSGKLTLSIKTAVKARERKKRSQNFTIGTAKFSIAAEDTTTVKIKLNGAGRGLLHTAHGRLTAHLVILELAPGPESTQAKIVQLVQRK